jgi:hypothetical protein
MLRFGLCELQAEGPDLAPGVVDSGMELLVEVDQDDALSSSISNSRGEP